MPKAKKSKQLELPPPKPSLKATASSRTVFNQSGKNVDIQINIDGNVSDGNIIIGDKNYIIYVKRTPKISSLIRLGILLPLLDCLYTLILYVAQSRNIGSWVLNTKEIIELLIILIALLFFSFVLLATRLSSLGKATIGYTSRINLKYFFATMREGIKQISLYIKAHPNWIEAIKSAFKNND